MSSQSELDAALRRIAELEEEKQVLAEEKQVLAEEKQVLAEEKQILVDKLSRHDPLSFYPCLYACYALLYKDVRAVPSSQNYVPKPSDTTGAQGRFYPRELRVWGDFPNIHEQTCKETSNFLLHKDLFSVAGLESDHEKLASFHLRTERDVEFFLSIAVQHPALSLFNKLAPYLKTSVTSVSFRQQVSLRVSQATSTGKSSALHKIAVENAASLKLNSPHATKKQTVSKSPTSVHSTPNSPGAKKKRAASKSPLSPPPAKKAQRQRFTYPNGVYYASGLHNDQEFELPLLVIECKKAHLLTADIVREALQNTSTLGSRFFADVISKSPMPASAGESVKKSRTIIAQAIAQTYDYMIESNVAYGCLTSGLVTLFLHFKPEDPRMLLYRVFVHHDETRGIASASSGSNLTFPDEISLNTAEIQATPVAQMITMLVLAARNFRQEMFDTSGLKRWPDLYPDQRLHATNPGSSNARSDSSTDSEDPPNAGSGASGAGASGVEARTIPIAPKNPLDDYCTQECLLGLVNGGLLDPACPNFERHMNSGAISEQFCEDGHAMHPITQSQLCSIIKNQLARFWPLGAKAYADIGGRTGVMIKFTAYPYGYTFVGKGLRRGYEDVLEHEVEVYRRLEKVQGVVVPVFLGTVELVQLYWGTIDGTKSFLLMSYGGEAVGDDGYLEEETDLLPYFSPLAQTLTDYGIIHGDLRLPNLLCDPKSKRLMIIDFDAAEIYDEFPEQETSMAH